MRDGSKNIRHASVTIVTHPKILSVTTVTISSRISSRT